MMAQANMSGCGHDDVYAQHISVYIYILRRMYDVAHCFQVFGDVDYGDNVCCTEYSI